MRFHNEANHTNYDDAALIDFPEVGLLPDLTMAILSEPAHNTKLEKI